MKPQDNTFQIVSIQTTYRCNMACANCYLGDMLNNPKFKDIDIIKFEDAISKLPRRCDIRFIGAEPTLADNLFDMIKIARKYKHRPQVLTNGLKLGQEDYVIKLKRAGLNFLGLSMNGGLDDEVYKRFDNGKYAKLKQRALEYCIKHKIVPHINIIVDPTNLHVINPLINYAIELCKKYNRKIGIGFPITIRIKSVAKMGNFLDTYSFSIDELIKIIRKEFGEFTDENSFRSVYSTMDDVNPMPIHFLYEYPKADDITDPQKFYIQQYIEDFERALKTGDFSGEERAYAEFIDTDSFIDFFLLTELAGNVDGYRISTFIHKDRGGKLVMGPIWDFNLGFGKAENCNSERTDIWAYQFNSECPWSTLKVPFWWAKLLEDPVYVNKLKERWSQLKESHFSYSSIENRILDLVFDLDKHNAVNRDFRIWPNINPHGHIVFETHAEEIAYLKTWISERLAWLDESINNL